MRETPFTRVITRVNANGKSEVATAGPAEVVEFEPSHDRLEDTLWASDIWIAAPGVERHPVEIQPNDWELEPPPEGAIFRIVNFPPHSSGDLHMTRTLDFGVVLTGEVWLILEDDEIRLTEHDCTVIPGAMHAWQNRSGRPCMMAAILLSSKTP